MHNLVGITHNQRQLCAANTADGRIVIHSMGHIKMALAHFPTSTSPSRSPAPPPRRADPSEPTIPPDGMQPFSSGHPLATSQPPGTPPPRCQQTIQPAMINLLRPRLTIHARPDQDGMRNQGIIRVPSTGSPVITKPSSSHRGMEASVPAIAVRAYSSS